MATQLLKTVKPSGGDYTSLEACMNANEQDLTAADKYFDVEWESSNTRIIIRYNKITRYYIQIIEEEWKPLKLIFKKSDLIS